MKYCLLLVAVMAFLSASPAPALTNIYLQCGEGVEINFPSVIWQRLSPEDQRRMQSALRNLSKLGIRAQVVVDQFFLHEVDLDKTDSVANGNQWWNGNYTFPTFLAVSRSNSTVGLITEMLKSDADRLRRLREEDGNFLRDLGKRIRNIEDEIRRAWGLIENASLNADGSAAAFCNQPDDQCAFRDSATGISVSALAMGREPSRPGRLVLDTFEDAQKYCAEHTWAGYHGWRLASYNESVYLADREQLIFEKFPYFGGNNAFFWTSGFPNAFGRIAAVYAPTKSWTIHVETGRSQQLPKTSKATFRCVRNDASKLWDDISLSSDGKKRVACTTPGNYCIFRLRSTELSYTSPRTMDWERDGRGVEYEEAKNYCEKLDLAGDTGWRLATYEEAYLAGTSLYYSFSLSRDGIPLQPTGEFWVSPPRVDDEPLPLNQYDTSRFVSFKGYVCDFERKRCRRLVETDVTYRGPYQHHPALPRAGIVCVKKYK